MKRENIIPPRDALSERAVTMRDVAEYANVSTMTVSRVLNGRGGVHDATRARVERAIAALGFTPNGAARNLAGSKGALDFALRPAPNIAFVFDRSNAAFLDEMVTAGLEEAASAGVQLVFIKACAGHDAVEAVRSMASLGIEGVILPPPFSGDARLRLLFAEARVRVVAMGCHDGDPCVSTIGIDDRRAAFDMTRYLVRLGHRRIGFVHGHARHRSSELRRAGFEAALVAHGIEPDLSLQWEGGRDFGTALAAAERALDASPPITAILASNDDIAAAVVSVARGRGVSVPRSLTVCGLEDREVARMIAPRLTTVVLPVAEMVRRGVEQLAGELSVQRDERPPKIVKLLLAHSITFGASDAPPERREPS